MNSIFRTVRQLFSGELPVTDRLKYSMIIYPAAAIHGFLMLFFAFQHIPPMTYYHLFSTLFYFGCYLLIQREAFFLIYHLVCVEVYLNTLFSTWFISWDCGFGMFLFIVLPVTLYVAYTFPGKRIRAALGTFLSFGITSCIIFLVSYHISHIHTAVFSFTSPQALHFLYLFHTLCTFGILTLVSILFVIEIRIAQRELQRENKILSRLARIDALTGLYNRWSMQEFLQESAADGSPFCLIMCDIDDFKHINDTYGHECGDTVLKDIARIICEQVPSSDYVCRWGGEEILILQNNCSLKESARMAEKIRLAVSATPTLFHGHRISRTITMGIASHSRNQTLEHTIAAADTWLYTGKRQGKNVVISEPF